MASASTSAALSPPTDSCFEVFLCHRGRDTKNSFSSFLYRRLTLHGVRVFWDKEEMQVGDTLTSQIRAAIQTSSLCVVVFSPRFAESKWCLDELLSMVESGKFIIPVYYNVQPTDVRWTRGGNGVYAEALQNLERKRAYDSDQPRYNSTTIEKWRAALSTVAEISGLELKMFDEDEGELLEKIVESVLKKLKKTRFDVAKYPTGLEEKIKDFENRVLLQQQSGKPQVIGIVGLGGIGKTTLVQELWNRKSSNYQTSLFLGDVRENVRKYSLQSLQKKLLKSFTQLDLDIESVSEGKAMLRDSVLSCKALVIIDDVDHADQLDALLTPIRNVLSPDSLILITTRDKAVLIKSRVEGSSIYKLTGLNPQHSKELFCLHAFAQGHPLPGFEDLVDQYLKDCNGLPLSLKVLGDLLYGTYERHFWKNCLEKLLPQDIRRRLVVSYNALQPNQQQMFLDIACFFIGENRDKAIRIWDGSGWKGSLGFQSLQDKSLVEVDRVKKYDGVFEYHIRMHNHLRDLGRYLAKEPGLPRRIWRREDLDDLLQQSSEVTEVRGICIGNNQQEVTEVRGICMGSTEYDSRSFSGCKMKNLQLLDVRGDLLDSILSVVHLPKLVWLRARNYRHSSLPPLIPMNNLRVLEVERYITLETLWQEVQQAPLQLRELHIKTFLGYIPESIGLLKHLEWFVATPDRAGFYQNFQKLPEEFCHLASLKHLYIWDCPMESLPRSFGNLTNLESIGLQAFGNLKRLPDSFGSLTMLKYLKLGGCRNLTMSSETFGNICTLEQIYLYECGSIEVLPSQLARQRSMETLHLRFLGIKELPSDIGELSNLKDLMLDGLKCKCLPNSIGQLSQLPEFRISRCEDLVEIETLPDAETIRLERCPKLSSVKGLCGLAKLRRLRIYYCEGLEELPNIETLASLEELWVDKCEQLRSIRGLARLTKLRIIHLYWCSELEEMEGVEQLRSLESLFISGCYKLQLPQLGEGVYIDTRKGSSCINTDDSSMQIEWVS